MKEAEVFILNKIIGKVIFDKVTFEQRPEERASHVDMRGGGKAFRERKQRPQSRSIVSTLRKLQG